MIYGTEKQTVKIVITVIFGLESVVRQELLQLGFIPEAIHLSDGQVALYVHEKEMPAAIARCNFWLRSAERVLLQIGEGTATSFDQLFDLTGSVMWEAFIPTGWAFHVDGYSRHSILFGISACQSIIKKSIVSSLAKKTGRGATERLPEDERLGLVKITFSIVKNKVSYLLDTTGDGLHKRGYRPLAHPSPIRETLAAGLIQLSRWPHSEEEALFDPMCGSGTIPIEAAMIACHIAPGINRTFASEKLPLIHQKPYQLERENALDIQNPQKQLNYAIFGGDIDGKNVSLSEKNAKSAGVSRQIRFLIVDVTKLRAEQIKQITNKQRTLLITNPPYGERVMEKQEAADLYKSIGSNLLQQGKVVQGLRLSVIAPCDLFETAFGGVADKRRKLYNGTIPCNMYHYFKNGR
jgi:putative N6-adenine-specific DNA methylase